MSSSKHVWGAAVALGIAAAGFIEAPGLTQGRSTGRIVWRGEMRHRSTRSAGSKQGRAENVVTFETIQEPDQDGNLRDVSHTLTWKLSGVASLMGAVVVDTATGRQRGDWSSTCLGQGQAVRRGDSPEERDRFYSQITAGETRCVRSPADVHVFGTFSSGTWSSPDSNFGPVPWEELRDRCELTTRSRYYQDGALIEESVRISVSAPVTAVMEISRRAEDAYVQFVPTPGATLTFTASVPAGTARFRFELDPEATSRFPGYATNANIDDAFLAKHELAQLPGGYANDGPDVIFHPKYHTASEWSRVEPLVLESANPQSAAVVTVTTLDYGAVGKLRAFVKSEECGDWQPVPVRFGSETRESVSIPLDADDNLMADALEDYRTLAPGVDDDAGPRGNGISGDGLTSFEEYRGFVTSIDPNCESTSNVSHVRTNPRNKDLFVHSPDPILAAEAARFKDSSGLDVHLICPIHYVDNQTRVVNFTMQGPPRAAFGGRPLTQSWPQHGLYLVDANLPSRLGQSPYGPPGRVDKVEVDLLKIGQMLSSVRQLTNVVRHELGHALGINHHGDGNHFGPIVLLNMPRCRSGMTPGRVAGQPACLVEFVAVRQGQNSGNEECPMRYVSWAWYVPPGQTLTAAGTVSFSRNQSWSWLRRRQLPGYEGQVLPYLTFLEQIGIGKFDNSIVGTGINALPGRENHAGDGQRACSSQLQVSDSPGPSGPAGG